MRNRKEAVAIVFANAHTVIGSSSTKWGISIVEIDGRDNKGKEIKKLTSSANENLIHRSCTFYGTLYALKEICKVSYAGGGGAEGEGCQQETKRSILTSF